MPAMLALAAAALSVSSVGALPRSNQTKRMWGPSSLEEICVTTPGDDLCHRYGKITAPLDHDAPAEGSHEIAYFVNSDFWDPQVTPSGPIFINMWYGGTTPGGYANSLIRAVEPNADGLLRQFPGVSLELAEELGALIISVPNRYYGCETARAGNPEGTCPQSLEPIDEGPEGVIEAHERLRFLSLKSVVDDIAFVARQTITTFAEDWGMAVPVGSDRAPNQPIVMGCSWPGSAATYARMLHPDVFPGAVPTSHPLVSSPDGNNHYRSFVGHVYELYSAGGSLECRNVLSVGHEEIKRIIEDEGVDNGPVGSCHRDCKISERVNADFERADGTYWSFGGGIPGLPGIQSINRACTGFGCDVESACGYILDCFAEATDPFETTFPISTEDPVARGAAYQCLVDYSAETRNPTHNHAAAPPQNDTKLSPREKAEEAEEEEQRSLMEYKPELLQQAFNLGPLVYQSNTLTFQMFGFKGPLWMTQTCNDGSGCPFTQGSAGGASVDQINNRLWWSYGKPGETLEEFIEMMRREAGEWNRVMGGQRPWDAPAMETTNIYMSYNDADPWTGTGTNQHLNGLGRNLTYDLGGGGIAHCVDPAVGAREWIRDWSTPADIPEMKRKTKAK